MRAPSVITEPDVTPLDRAVNNRRRQLALDFARFAKERDQIIQLEKLSAIGQMVTEIAHQLNTPLLGVLNLAQLAEREAENPRRVKTLLREVQNAGRLCRDYVQQMLQFNAPARFKPKPTDMAQLVNDTVTFFRKSIGRGPTISLDLPNSATLMEVDSVLLGHALFNLLHNAAQADPNGQITVSLKTSEFAGILGGLLVVCDDGEGISDDIADKLFIPFFTTRSGGTGLGLPVAQQIVLQHGGMLRAENRPEGGASFMIWLPFRSQRKFASTN